MRKAVFLDKDGTIIEDLPYNVDPDNVVFLPRAWEGLCRLYRSGYALVIVTNQSGVARGYCTEHDLLNLGEYFSRSFRRHGIILSGFYFCPHLPGGSVPEYSIDCSCRKPAPGLITRAARELRIDVRASWCIGNVATDIEAGRSAGCATILVASAGPLTPPPRGGQTPHHTCRDLTEASIIVDRSAQALRSP